MQPLWRPSRSAPAAAPIIVVTDIDASLLESGRAGRDSERTALDFLAARGVPLVINSSRTRAEIERLQRTLQVQAPFISEHGSALFVPYGCFDPVPERAVRAVGGSVIEFGKRYHQVVDTLRLACREIGVEVVGFAELTIDDVARELGVATVEAQLAKLREYTELFHIVDDNEVTRHRLYKALRRRGLRCWPVGSHHLVTAVPDRAEGLRTLKALWRPMRGLPFVIGFGDSDDDVAWLRQADIAVVVPDRRTGVPPRVLSRLPTARVAPSAGRHGWSEAVIETVGELLDRREATPASALRSYGRPHRAPPDQSR